jgi:predicted deacylase
VEPTPFYPIGKPGHPWDDAARATWRTSKIRLRSYADDVLSKLDALDAHWARVPYGRVEYDKERFPLIALRSKNWVEARPTVLVTGGVHGYETSGVQGALLFLQQFASSYTDKANLLVAPCISPWAYERVQRWNANAVDPNRAFTADSTCEEAQALVRLVEPLREQILLHIDLHETTDTDESEFRRALAARDGKTYEPGSVPDGFYLVGDTDAHCAR